MNKYIRHPRYLLLRLAEREMLSMSDEKYLRLRYQEIFDKEIDLNSPKTFNEKMQWLKLNDRKPEYVKMVDKYEVKKYVSSILGEEYIIPTLGVYDKFDDIDFEKLPDQFVVKCTHDSGGVSVVNDKNMSNLRLVKKKINKSLKRNFYFFGREWPYKNIKPRIIIEKFIDDGHSDLKDYKFFCFNGEPKIVLVCSERFTSDNMCETWFNTDWELLPFTEGGHRVDKSIPRPSNFELMRELASKLSNNIPFVRVDFYDVKGKIFFGEMTFYPASGLERFDPPEWDEKIGELLDLNEVNRNE